MGSWTHLIRFIAKEDQQVHLGQLVDTSRDAGRDSVDGIEIKAYLIRGSIFDGKVNVGVVYTVERVCPILRCDDWSVFGVIEALKGKLTVDRTDMSRSFSPQYRRQIAII